MPGVLLFIWIFDGSWESLVVRYFLLLIRFEISFGCEDLVSSLVFLNTSFIASALKASFAGRILAISFDIQYIKNCSIL